METLFNIVMSILVGIPVGIMVLFAIVFYGRIARDLIKEAKKRGKTIIEVIDETLP